jgi:hypothetical protein
LILVVVERPAAALAAVPLIGVSGAVISIGLAFLLLRHMNLGGASENLTGAVLLGFSASMVLEQSGLETTLFARCCWP